MPKAYFLSIYRAIKDPAKVAAYAQLARPALEAGGGMFLARGTPATTFEQGLDQRTVVIQFDSVEQARAAYASPAYQEALKLLGDGAERDIRLMEGV